MPIWELKNPFNNDYNFFCIYNFIHKWIFYIAIWKHLVAHLYIIKKKYIYALEIKKKN